MKPLLTAAKATTMSNVNAIPSLKNIAGRMIKKRLTAWWTIVRPAKKRSYLEWEEVRQSHQNTNYNI